MNFKHNSKTRRRWLLRINLIVINLTLAGCAQSKGKGSEPDSDLVCPPPFYAAFRSDTNLFDLDDVTLTFFYGGRFPKNIEFEIEHAENFPSFNLYFEDEEDNRYLVKHVDENFVSEKYRVEMTYKDGDFTQLTFKHSEELTVPKEVFIREKGLVWFVIRCCDYIDSDRDMKIITYCHFYYKIFGSRVFISYCEFE